MESNQYYRNLAEMYEFNKRNELKPYNQLLIAKGVLYKMEDELLAYQRKSGNRDKIKESSERLNILFEFVENISAVLSENIQLKILLKESMVERSNLEDIAIKLTKELKFSEE